MSYDPQKARLRALLEVAGNGLLNADPVLLDPARNAWDEVFKSHQFAIGSSILARLASADGAVLDGVADQVKVEGTALVFEAGIVPDLLPLIVPMFGTSTQTNPGGDRWNNVFRFDRSGDTDLPERLSLLIDNDRAARRFALLNTLTSGLKFTINQAGLVQVDATVLAGGVSSFGSTPDATTHTGSGNTGTLFVDGFDGVGLYQATADAIVITVTAKAAGTVTFTAVLNAEAPITYTAIPTEQYASLRYLIQRAGDIAPVLPRVWISEDATVGDKWTLTNQPAGWTVEQGPALRPLAQIWSVLNLGGVELPLQGVEINLTRGASAGWNIGHLTPAYAVYEGAQLALEIVAKRKLGIQLSDAQNLKFDQLRSKAIHATAIEFVADSGQARPGAASASDTYKITFSADRFEASGGAPAVDRTGANPEETINLKLLGNWTLSHFGDSELPERA